MSENDLLQYIQELEPDTQSNTQSNPQPENPESFQQFHDNCIPENLSFQKIPEYCNEQNNYKIFGIISETIIGIIRDIYNGNYHCLFSKQNRQTGLMLLGFVVFFIYLIFKAFDKPNSHFYSRSTLI